MNLLKRIKSSGGHWIFCPENEYGLPEIVCIETGMRVRSVPAKGYFRVIHVSPDGRILGEICSVKRYDQLKKYMNLLYAFLTQSSIPNFEEFRNHVEGLCKLLTQ